VTGPSDIVIRGAGGFAKEVAVLIEQVNQGTATQRWNLLGFIDAEAPATPTVHGKYPVLGDDDFLRRRSEPLAVAIAIGTPQANARVAQDLLTLPHLTFPTLVHPSVIYDAETVKFGEGVIVCAGGILTTDIVVGPFTILNLSVTVGHDTVIGRHCVLNPHVDVAGGTVIGDRCLLGTGAMVLQRLRVGEDARVGAGAVATRDVAPGLTVVGVPARPV
jgi:sugar O-acyltransferase (sialic acid O-acetyltransferase NeuD family)